MGLDVVVVDCSCQQGMAVKIVERNSRFGINAGPQLMGWVRPIGI